MMLTVGINDLAKGAIKLTSSNETPSKYFSSSLSIV